MAKPVKVVLKRRAFNQQVLHKAVEPVIDDVEAHMRSEAAGDDRIKVYRNEDTDRANVVATCPAPVEREHGTLTRMLGGVRV
ncbi:hypothetical protein CS006_10385 [Bifidobacterium primatium]|uniref:Uncharacterized protein n=2 Tax=Bifidobacterium TaxID=1678 RepID=A0A2M9H6C8_9BIFI|nr:MULTISPECIES: hypothetical protein [Bifidobacterium]NEG96012.1 hypothetical protein [Bifidobacterium sp. SMB2]NEH10910.1 hypothetical protein [Bifidobacterium saimiriisciurei]PJM72335.1 hypothetical protein CS006_10385 [Bifidobacterium primatium]